MGICGKYLFFMVECEEVKRFLLRSEKFSFIMSLVVVD